MIGKDASRFAEMRHRLLAWYAAHGRDLPWRHTRDPYAILVSEMMLQQTQVHRVLPKYVQFLERFPTFRALAEASSGDVIRLWAPLGYNQRAVRLQRIAKTVMAEHAGALPGDEASLRGLAGIGEYTSAAVRCFAFGHRVPVIDTNVRRVLGRYFLGTSEPPATQLADLAKSSVPPDRAWAWNQALMDLGATVCLSQRPRCPLCPLRDGCQAADAKAPALMASETPAPYGALERRSHSKQAPFKGSNRYYRGRILAALRDLPAGARLDLEDLAARLVQGAPLKSETAHGLSRLVVALERDGLLVTNISPGGLTVSLPA